MRKDEIETARSEIAKGVLEVCRRLGLHQRRVSPEVVLDKYQSFVRSRIPARVTDRTWRKQRNPKPGGCRPGSIGRLRVASFNNPHQQDRQSYAHEFQQRLRLSDVRSAINDARLMKRLLTLEAFVALPAMLTGAGIHARQSQLKRQVLELLDQVFLMQTAERRLDQHDVRQAHAQRPRKGLEELRRSIGKGIAAK